MGLVAPTASLGRLAQDTRPWQAVTQIFSGPIRCSRRLATSHTGCPCLQALVCMMSSMWGCSSHFMARRRELRHLFLQSRMGKLARDRHRCSEVVWLVAVMKCWFSGGIKIQCPHLGSLLKTFAGPIHIFSSRMSCCSRGERCYDWKSLSTSQQQEANAGGGE